VRAAQHSSRNRKRIAASLGWISDCANTVVIFTLSCEPMENPTDHRPKRSFPLWMCVGCAFLILVIGGLSFLFGLRKSTTGNATNPSLATPEPAPGTNVIRLIDLTNHYSCSLTNAVNMGRLKVHPNNLEEFPEGEGEFGGVLFAVHGMIQLGGAYPRECRGIKLGMRMRALHILHGTAGLRDDGTEIARLILHYANGEEHELAINYGEHARDWWAWKEGEDPHVGPGSELAWTGSNRYAKTKNVGLRIYRSTFLNPFPDKAIETIDYVRLPSTGLTPFMLGLTIEEAK
jgi:hypothetical protein